MSPLRAPEYVSSSLADATHRMVCRSPVFPKIPLLGVRALPHRDQNYGERAGGRLVCRADPLDSTGRRHCYLDVFDSTAHQAALLQRVPADVEDLWGQRTCGRVQYANVCGTHTLTLSECPVAAARTFPLFHSQIQTVFLASRPTEASRCRGSNTRQTWRRAEPCFQ